ncbi:hypothetical protein ACGF0J_06090 [Nonomuraea sp. NPDC047897]|uniref:hypothetical protein n=1 Tax=Nonomuraea sp. NPDC047897 TaxID=3364346 RepID=UPI00370FE659
MSNSVRHVLGLAAGVLLPPLAALALMYGIGELTLSYQRFLHVSVPGLAGLVIAAVLLAFLLGSRLSPVASLLGGLVCTVVGFVPVVELSGVRVLPDEVFTGVLGLGFRTLLYTWMLLVLGVALLVASAFPSRWRSVRPPVVTPGHGYGGAPYGPAPGHPSGPQGGALGGPAGGPLGGPVSGPGGTPPGPYPSSPGSEDATRPMHRE